MADVQILTLSCRDKPGITARVTGYLFALGCNVLEAQQFNDQDEDRFFMRVEFDPGGTGTQAIDQGFVSLAAEYGMHWTLRPKGTKDLTEAEMMRAGQEAGLVDVKVVSFSDLLTAEKFVIPVAKRAAHRPGAVSPRTPGASSSRDRT